MKEGLDAQQAGLDAMKAGLEARQAGLVAREEGITAREEGVKDKEKAVVAREEAVVAREEAVEAGEESLKTGKMDLEGNWFDYADRKMKLDKRDHDCSALDDLKHTLKLMDDAAEHSGVRPGRVKNQHKAQQSLTVLTALKDSLVQQVRHLLANDAGLDLTIWLDHVDAMEDDLEEMGDFDFQRISKKDITSLKDELVKDVRNLLEYDAMIFHRP